MLFLDCILCVKRDRLEYNVYLKILYQCKCFFPLQNNIELVHYVWAMCRDQTILKHEQAWKVLEFAVQQTSQYY